MGTSPVPLDSGCHASKLLHVSDYCEMHCDDIGLAIPAGVDIVSIFSVPPGDSVIGVGMMVLQLLVVQKQSVPVSISPVVSA